MSELSAMQIDELQALARTNDALKGPSFIMRSHWHDSGYAGLVRRGLVQWGKPPEGFDPKKFAGVTITAKGRDLVRPSPASEE